MLGIVALLLAMAAGLRDPRQCRSTTLVTVPFALLVWSYDLRNFALAISAAAAARRTR